MPIIYDKKWEEIVRLRRDLVVISTRRTKNTRGRRDRDPVIEGVLIRERETARGSDATHAAHADLIPAIGVTLGVRGQGRPYFMIYRSLVVIHHLQGVMKTIEVVAGTATSEVMSDRKPAAEATIRQANLTLKWDTINELVMIMSRLSRQTDAPVEEIKDDSTVPLDPEDLKILGKPTAKKNNDSLLHVDVRTLWENLVLTGLDEETKTQLLKTYPKLERFAA
ncbi:hypothetical protein QAD02_014507 [Eretmocerus hayati]|uniref:Uncharacterized protein n=1 Tax=Eretmocerus hayati TaxID=131215 RepID=A0ACC2PAE7_9HYME|nr:hypothetical protein QAD02_014507 [Eretmocerus hayati]